MAPKMQSYFPDTTTHRFRRNVELKMNIAACGSG